MSRLADVAQKGAVLGLMSMFGYQVYQIADKTYEKKIESKYMHTKMFDKINEKVEEEERNKGGIDKIPDRYDPDDNSYLKKVPKLDLRRGDPKN